MTLSDGLRSLLDVPVSVVGETSGASGLSERIGEAVEDGVEATVTWPRRLTKKPATWRLLESIGLL